MTKLVEDNMKYAYGVVHGQARCIDCGWETDSYKNAQAIAKIHAKKHKHNVEGDLGISFSYYGKEGMK